MELRIYWPRVPTASRAWKSRVRVQRSKWDLRGFRDVRSKAVHASRGVMESYRKCVPLQNRQKTPEISRLSAKSFARSFPNTFGQFGVNDAREKVGAI